jgi:hypothetical protein
VAELEGAIARQIAEHACPGVGFDRRGTRLFGRAAVRPLHIMVIYLRNRLCWTETLRLGTLCASRPSKEGLQSPSEILKVSVP